MLRKVGIQKDTYALQNDLFCVAYKFALLEGGGFGGWGWSHHGMDPQSQRLNLKCNTSFCSQLNFTLAYVSDIENMRIFLGVGPSVSHCYRCNFNPLKFALS